MWHLFHSNSTEYNTIHVSTDLQNELLRKDLWKVTVGRYEEYREMKEYKHWRELIKSTLLQ